VSLCPFLLFIPSALLYENEKFFDDNLALNQEADMDMTPREESVSKRRW
jgi:hypothetical protein